jgi:hypothetical protein
MELRWSARSNARNPSTISALRVDHDGRDMHEKSATAAWPLWRFEKIANCATVALARDQSSSLAEDAVAMRW